MLYLNVVRRWSTSVETAYSNLCWERGAKDDFVALKKKIEKDKIHYHFRVWVDKRCHFGNVVGEAYWTACDIIASPTMVKQA